MKYASIIVALLISLACITPARSAEEAGVIMLDSQTVAGQMLHLNGIALREKFFVDVYVAGLYLAEKSTDPDAILQKDETRMLVMYFVHDVEASKINDAWYEGLENNVAPISPELRAKFDQLAEMMSDIKEDESMTFIYEPRRGTTVIVKRATKGTIPGKDFADAILATWIGPNPGPGINFKEALLGQ
ncbi:chalcone isomerase family protein [Pseudodesulfovibrio sediminis]|uniref:Chalcone isomerase domain-containing protein n=1 Tax=Pseudodesulfovibrio sediminis TaxID=2810563 RepID=A0ABM8I310_9BACT|nr:chalcone isomerase family protein [Pseudodesulfovibrio sediminis]BCS87018.1 hypothetical protein PSDVSF_02600 [Pseudodesulfovibrio sediminis]